MATSETDGAAALEQLLYHHQVGRSGLSLVPQGTPTHNTTGTGTGYTVLDDADESFDDRRTSRCSPRRRTSGASGTASGWPRPSASAPACSPRSTPAAARTRCRPGPCSGALWPATLGYWMDKMMTPVFGDDAVAADPLVLHQLRQRPRPGAGPAHRRPALRHPADHRVLPDRLAPPAHPGRAGRGAVLAFLAELYAVAMNAGTDWTAMSGQAAHVGGAGDPHQTLLDVVGLHPSSVEYYSRGAESISELFNVLNLWGFGPQFFQALEALGLGRRGGRAARRLGYQGQAEPDILQHLFLTAASQLGTVIDDQPLSETSPIRAYTSDGRNYLSWLIDAAKTSLDAVVAEQGFADDVSPQALLYLYLRHALMLGYYDSAYGLYRSSGALGPAELAALKPEAPFVHVAETAPASESRFAVLFTPEPAITSSPTMLVSDYITANLPALAEAAGLADQLAALSVLADAPTGQLERAFAEHVDLCGYRYDAWLLALVNYQLEQMRAAQANQETRLRRAASTSAPTHGWKTCGRRRRSSRPAAAGWTRSTRADPILADPANGGYVHAPRWSTPGPRPSCAAATWVTPPPPTRTSLAVNLSSDRVRTALGVLEGMRNGQSIGALLGYRFERGLHDDHGLAEVDKFIYPMRKAFPLVADNLAPTATPPGVPIEAIEARNVMDGRKLIDQIASSGVTGYPFGIATLPAATAAEAAAINAEAERPAGHLRRASATWPWPRACTRRAGKLRPDRRHPGRLYLAASRPTRRSSRRRRPASG